MTLVRWRPFGDLLNMHDKINRLFEDEFLHEKEQGLGVRPWTPATDIYETQEEYVFRLELPGIKKEDIKVEFDGDTLTITGERKEEKEVKKENFHRIERCCGSFKRAFNIPKNVDANKIAANMKDGILELKVPKIEESKTKAIPISVK